MGLAVTTTAERTALEEAHGFCRQGDESCGRVPGLGEDQSSRGSCRAEESDNKRSDGGLDAS